MGSRQAAVWREEGAWPSPRAYDALQPTAALLSLAVVCAVLHALLPAMLLCMLMCTVACVCFSEPASVRLAAAAALQSEGGGCDMDAMVAHRRLRRMLLIDGSRRGRPKFRDKRFR